MWVFFLIIVVGLFFVVCGKSYGIYMGFKVMWIVVEKVDCKMYLMYGLIVLCEYDVGLGFVLIGDKF